MKHDPVRAPSHYTQGEVEHLDSLRSMLTAEEWRGYLRGQVHKYIWRMAGKGSPLEDALKAEFYLRRLIEQLQQEERA